MRPADVLVEPLVRDDFDGFPLFRRARAARGGAPAAGGPDAEDESDHGEASNDDNDDDDAAHGGKDDAEPEGKDDDDEEVDDYLLLAEELHLAIQDLEMNGGSAGGDGQGGADPGGDGTGSGGGAAPEPPEPPLPPPRWPPGGGPGAAGPREAADVCVRWRGHTIRYYHKIGDMVAECGQAGHGKNCKATRTCVPKTARKRGAGRPLGFLGAWLLDTSHATSAAHKAAKDSGYNFNDRRDARDLISTECPDAHLVMSVEKRLPDCEPRAEPKDFD